MIDARRLLRSARLYLVCEDQPSEFLEAALRGGVDVVQLRMKGARDQEVVSAARRFTRTCAQHGALLILNDRPDLVVEAGADGAHVGQDDVPAREARDVIGADRILGLSTHTREQVRAASALPVDYIGVGPVHETPTKPGRPPVGMELIRYASGHVEIPFFAIGGISSANIGAVRAAGASRVAVVRALTEAEDPALAARELRRGLVGAETERRAPVGST